VTAPNQKTLQRLKTLVAEGKISDYRLNVLMDDMENPFLRLLWNGTIDATVGGQPRWTGLNEEQYRFVDPDLWLSNDTHEDSTPETNVKVYEVDPTKAKDVTIRQLWNSIAAGERSAFSQHQLQEIVNVCTGSYDNTFLYRDTVSCFVPIVLKERLQIAVVTPAGPTHHGQSGLLITINRQDEQRWPAADRPRLIVRCSDT
jgi:hypothetical protein